MAKSIVGVDLGSSHVKLVMREGGAVRAVSRRLPNDIIEDGRVVAPETMAQLLRQVRAEEHVRARDCAVVLSPDQCYFRHVSLPPMTAGELKLNLPYEFRDYIDDDPASYVYDYAVDQMPLDDLGRPERLELYAAAVQQATVDDLDAMLHKAGFKLRGIFPPQMAIARLLADHATAHPEDAESDTVVVDLGTGTVGVSLYHGEKYQAHRVVDFGCRAFDQAVADVRNIDRYTAATYVQTNFEGVLDTPECRAVCDRICVEVNKVVNFYNFSNRDKDIQRMYIMGGGAQVPQLVVALRDAVGIPVLSVTELMGGGGAPSGAELAHGTAGLAPQYALAYACMREGEVS